MTPDGRLDVLVTGDVFGDLVFAGAPVPEPGTETYARDFVLSPGGAANRAVPAARLGRRVGVLAALGDDVLGHAVRNALSAEPGLRLDWLATVPGGTTPVSVALTGPDDRAFISYVEPLPVPTWPADGPAVGVVHIDVGRPLPSWLPALRATGTTVVAGSGWDASGAWSRACLDRLATADTFVPNCAEAQAFTRTSSPAQAAVALGRLVPLVVVTCGASGAIAYRRADDELVQVPGLAVPAADPTGAGDTFVSALMATDDLRWPLPDRLRLANLAAAVSVQRLGGATSAPRPAQLVAAIDTLGVRDDWDRVRDWLVGLDAAPPGRAESVC